MVSVKGKHMVDRSASLLERQIFQG